MGIGGGLTQEVDGRFQTVLIWEAPPTLNCTKILANQSFIQRQLTPFEKVPRLI